MKSDRIDTSQQKQSCYPDKRPVDLIQENIKSKTHHASRDLISSQAAREQS